LEAWNDTEKRRAIEEIATLLKGVLVARGKVLIKMNVLKTKVEELLDYLPALRPPTISTFYARGYSNNKEEEWLMVETVVKKSMLNEIIPKIKGIGVRDILEIDISKMIP
jgi:ATP phosphoribosyltransferase